MTTRSKKDLQAWMVAQAATLLAIPEHDVDVSQPFISLGLDSLALFNLTGDLAEWLGRDLDALVAWDHPTIEALAAYLASPSPLEDAGGALPRAPRDRPLPLSFSQERLFRHATLDGDGDRNGMVQRWIVRGDLDVHAIERSLAEVVRRHDILRTTFAMVDGEPRQIVHAGRTVPVEVLDLRRAPDPGHAASEAIGQRWRPMRLDLGPLFWVLVVRVDDQEWHLVFFMHHLLYDGTSMKALYDELEVFYAACRDGRELPELEPAVQIADYASWQRDRYRAGSDAHQALMGWWRAHWAEPLPPPVVLPCRRTPDVPERADDESTVLWPVPPALRDAVKAIAQRAHTTTYAVFLAAFETLVCRLSNQDQFVLGTYVWDRGVLTRRSLGYFVNLLSVRADLRGTRTFFDVVTRVADFLVEMSRHQALPLETLAEEFTRHGHAVPWVEMIFQQLQPDETTALRLAGTAVTRRRGAGGHLRRWGLSFTIIEHPNRISVRADFDTSLYDPARVAAMMRQYEALLLCVTSDPATPIGALAPPESEFPAPDHAER